jgi:O-antigen/teichoic acid export membrane protein
MPLRRAHGLIRGNRGEFFFFLATSAVNVTNFGFQVVVSHALGTDEYGGLSALLVLVVVLGVPLGALQLAAAHAQATAEPGAPARDMLRRTTLVALGAFALAAALSPLIESFLHLGSLAPVLLTAAWLPLAMIGMVPAGMLIGQRRFVALAVGTFLGGGLTRLVAALVLAPTMKTNGGVLATVVAQGVSTGIFLWAVRRQLVGGPGSLHLSSTQGILSLAAMGGLALATGVDTMLAQHVMPGEDASIYSAAAVAGRMALFAPAAVALIVFPRFVTARQEDQPDGRLLWGSLGAVLALGLAAVAVLTAAPHLVVRVLFGPEFTASANEVPLLAIEGAGLAVLTLLTYYHLARGGWTALTAAVGAAGLAVIIWAVHPGVHDLALIMTGTVVALAGLTVMRAMWVAATNQPEGHGEPITEAPVVEAASL